MMDSEVAQWQVLIIDDDTDSLGVAEQFLSFIGAKVVTATSGVEGFAAAESQPPTVVLLDLSMPDLDGWEVFRKLRTTPRTASIPVIALTAHAMKEDEERVKEAGFDGYITKPYILTSLLDEIKRYLALHTSRADRPTNQPAAPTGELPALPPTPNIEANGKADQPSNELTHETR